MLEPELCPRHPRLSPGTCDILYMRSLPLTQRSHGVSLCQVVIKDVPGAYGVVKESKGGRPSAIVHSQELTIQALRVSVVAPEP